MQLYRETKTRKFYEMKHPRFHKTYNIIIVPDDEGRVRQFRIPAMLTPILALTFILSAFFLAWSISDYHGMQRRLARASEMKKENTFQMEQIVHLKRQIDQLELRIGKLDNAYGKSGIFMKTGYGMTRHFETINFSLRTSQEDDPETAEMESLTRLMHHAQDKSNDGSSAIRNARTEQPMLLGDQLQGKMRTGQAQGAGKKYQVRKIREMIKTVATELDLEPSLALGMAKVESGFKTRAVSSKGAIGILQVTPQLAWDQYGITREELFHPQTNIKVGLSVMKSLLDRFDQNVDLALAAYNAGTSRVLRAGNRIPAIRETKMYVKKVRKAMEEF